MLAGLAGLLIWSGPRRVGASAFAWLAELSMGEAVALVLALLMLLAGLGALSYFVTELLAQQGRSLRVSRRSKGGPPRA